jgi:hypothetical protein
MVTAGWFMLLNLDHLILVEVFPAASLQIFTPGAGWPAATQRTPA